MKSIYCKGQIISDGALGITEKGFCYSDIEFYPILSNSNKLIIDNPIDIYGFYTGTITGLTQSHKYYINAYAINSSGVSYSDNSRTIQITTTGIGTFPTITAYITSGGIFLPYYEMGTSTNLIVSGETIKNDETIFNYGELKQTSSPPPPGGNTIFTWNGYQSTYSTYPNITVNFSPKSIEPQSWFMIQDVNYYVGSPQYVITSSSRIDSVFPYLWVLKDSIPLSSYFNVTGNPQSYFYKDASMTPNITSPANGKLVESKGDKTFLITPSSASTKYLILGYPAFYGNIQYSISGGPWGTPSNISTQIVNTGWLGYQYGIVNSWNYLYRITLIVFNNYYK